MSIPAKFLEGQHSPALLDYVSKKYTPYGSRRDYCNGIGYNPTWDLGSWKLRFIDNPERGLRLVGKVHEIRNEGYVIGRPYIDRRVIDHNGWYTNNFGESYKDGSGLCWGEVYQLPSRHGTPLYIPAARNGNDDGGASLAFDYWTSDLIEAIRRADRIAELYAESEREHEAKDMAETRIEELRDEIKVNKAEVRSLASEIRSANGKLDDFPKLKATAQAEIKRLLAKNQKHRKRIDELSDDFWAAVQQ